MQITDEGRRRANSKEFAEQVMAFSKETYGKVPDKIGIALLVNWTALTLAGYKVNLTLDDSQMPLPLGELFEFIDANVTEIDSIFGTIAKHTGWNLTIQ